VTYRLVLVGPENPLNVGFVARAMACFGVSELVIAATNWKTMPQEARRTGTSAPEVLDGARLTSTLAEALDGCDDAVAFSRRPTTLRQASFALPNVPEDLGRTGRTALVFGRESTGLTREEFALCPRRAVIPCREALSLNLGQAAAIALFALTAPRDAGVAAPIERTSLDRMLGLWNFLEPRLSAAPRFTPQRLRRVRQMLYRLALNDDDFDMLFAVMSELAVPAAVRRRAPHRM
jgi:tRNA/rRNA methyltransferase